MILARGLLLLLLTCLAGCSPMTFVVGMSPGDQRLVRTTVLSDGRWGSPKVALVDVSGLIINAERPALLEQGENPVSLLHEQLALAGADPDVAAVVLRLNTPGGAVTATDAMYRTIQRFQASTGKPVVALMMDMTTSGGYYLACAADEIITYPTSVTGSIGVIIQTVSFKPALERWGVETEALVSGPNKDVGSPLSRLTPSHRKVLVALVDDFYERFVAVVREARPGIPPDLFEEVTDGRVVSGEDAVILGLADRTGDLHDAIGAAMRLAGVEHADVVRYHRPLEYVGSPYASARAGHPGAGMQVNLAQINVAGLPGFDTPVGFYYLWTGQAP